MFDGIFKKIVKGKNKKSDKAACVPYNLKPLVWYIKKM